tara:strand:- start:747 stop:1211 length:465 start_codon:yes stop_codon:yes gene_type:complete
MESIINTIMDNSMFIKIIYTNKLLTINGLYLILDLNVTRKETYFKKIKYTYDLNNSYNNTILHKLYNIESSILDKYSSNKTKKYILYNTLNTGILKIFPNQPNVHNNSVNTQLTSKISSNELNSNNHPCSFILKISGIWENATEYGITYKLSPS